MPAGDQGSVQHLTLEGVPVDVLTKLLSFFSEVKKLECQYICSPQEVQCVHMYSVAWDATVFWINHYYTAIWLWMLKHSSFSKNDLNQECSVYTICRDGSGCLYAVIQTKSRTTPEQG